MKYITLLGITTSLLLTYALADEGQSITKAGTQASIKGSNEYFTGNVHVDYLFKDKASAPYSGAYVTFEPRARSFWHIHPVGQHLVVISGMGWTQEFGKAKEEVKAGDVIWCPPNVKHWHGATATTSMTHLAITGLKEGKSVQWMENVTDEQYLQNQPKE